MVKSDKNHPKFKDNLKVKKLLEKTPSITPVHIKNRQGQYVRNFSIWMGKKEFILTAQQIATRACPRCKSYYWNKPRKGYE